MLLKTVTNRALEGALRATDWVCPETVCLGTNVIFPSLLVTSSFTTAKQITPAMANAANVRSAFFNINLLSQPLILIRRSPPNAVILLGKLAMGNIHALFQ
jgi:hypothetical protein